MIRIDIDDREVSQALERLQRRVGDMTPAMDRCDARRELNPHTPTRPRRAAPLPLGARAPQLDTA